MENNNKQCFWLSPMTNNAVVYLPDLKLATGTQQSGASGNTRTVKEEMVWFCENTSGHGLSRLVDKGESCGCKFTWTVLITATVFGILYFLRDSTSQLFNPGLSTELVKMDETEMRFPDIHLCDYTALNSTVLEELGFDQTLSSYLLTVTSPMSLMNNESKLAEMETLLLERIRQLNSTLAKVLNLASLKCLDMVERCFVNNIVYTAKNCCDTYFADKTWLNMYGSCITTHGKTILQKVEVRDYGFTVRMRINRDHAIDLNGSDLVLKANYGNKHGIFYSVSDHGEFLLPSLEKNGIFAPLMSWTSNVIKKTEFDLTGLREAFMKVPYTCKIRNELNLSTDIPDYPNYNEATCLSTLQEKIIKKVSNCSDSLLPACSPMQYLKALPNISLPLFNKGIPNNDQCPKTCLVNEYSITPNSILLRQPGSDGIAVLSFHYARFSYDSNKIRPQTLVGFLGQVGGYMGLLMGVSLLTIIEFLIFLARCFRALILCRFSRLKKKT